MSAIPLRPLLSAGIFAAAIRVFMSAMMPYEDFGVDATIPAAVEISLNAVSISGWYALGYMFIGVHVIAFLRWMWHLALRWWTDHRRRDGIISNSAPWRFFVVNTNGWALWFSLWAFLVAFGVESDDGKPFQSGLKFISDHPFLILVFLFGMLALLRGFEWSSNKSLLDIYKTSQVAKVVKRYFFALTVLVFVGLLVWIHSLAPASV